MIIDKLKTIFLAKNIIVLTSNNVEIMKLLNTVKKINIFEAR